MCNYSSVYQPASHMLIHLTVFCPRHTLACSVWWWTPIKCCPFTQKRSLRCTKGRNDTRSPLISTPSLTMPTGTWCKVGSFHHFLLWCNLPHQYSSGSVVVPMASAKSWYQILNDLTQGAFVLLNYPCNELVTFPGLQSVLYILL